MATATLSPAVPDGTEQSPSVPASPERVLRHREYRCTSCGHAMRVYGLGRHRVYFNTFESPPDDVVMNGVCPQCGAELPGKNAS